MATASEAGTSTAETTGTAVTTSPGATPGNYCDDVDSFGYANGPNLAIGSALPNLQPGAHGNHAFGIGGRAGVPGNGPLGSVTRGYDDTAIGAGTLTSCTTGYGNTAVGADAASSLITANSCTAIGAQALESVRRTAGPGVGSTAIGQASQQNALGIPNDSLGAHTLGALTTGRYNVAVGFKALAAQTTASGNTGIGYRAGANIVTGDDNTIVGQNAGTGATTDSRNMTLVGRGTTGTGPGAVALGVDSGGTPASAGRDEFALGTANHQVKISNNAIGSRSAALGSNCPAKRVTEPYTWFKMMSSDGSTVYVPCWK